MFFCINYTYICNKNRTQFLRQHPTYDLQAGPRDIGIMGTNVGTYIRISKLHCYA